MTVEDGTIVHRDNLTRWNSKKTTAGYKEAVRNITRAFKDQSPVRLVMVRATHEADAKAISNGASGHHMPKTFSVREDVIGVIESFDGDNFVIRYSRSPK